MASRKSEPAPKSHEDLRREARQAFEEQDHAEGLTGTDSSYGEPPTEPYLDGTEGDNPENPRGIPSHLVDGMPDSQATDAQKAQNPVPKRPPVAADIDPPVSIQERVSAGQNRKPPQEVTP
jgi:hypothetical protein